MGQGATTQCPVPRVSVDALTQALLPYFPNTPPSQLYGFVREQLNSPYDKPPDRSNPWESVSRAEASWFVLETEADQRLGRATPERKAVTTLLQRMFFQGRIDWGPQFPEPKFPAQIPQCADGDTCKAVILEAPECPPLFENLRFSAFDTPESFHSYKLVRVRDEVTAKLLHAYGLSPAAGELLAPLVQFRIQYLGKLAALVMKDFPAWLGSQGGAFAVSNSYVAVEGNKYYGLWQAYDTYMRKVVTLHAPPEAIARYFAERLPELMATAGQNFYQESLASYQELFREVFGRLQAPQVASALAPETLLNPAVVYTLQAGALLAETWRNGIGSTGYGDDWMGAMMLAGVGYYYPKYKNQHGEMYERIHRYSQGMGLGLWRDLVYRLMDPAGENRAGLNS